MRIGIPTGKKLKVASCALFAYDLQLLDTTAITKRQFRYLALGKAWEFIFIASHDIAPLLHQEVIDVGITGSDYAYDYAKASGAQLTPLLDLGFCVGNIHVLVPQLSPIRQLDDLAHTTIATHLPNLTRAWCDQRNLTAVTIRPTHGTSEVYPSLKLAEATVDVVCTGETARSNGLRQLTRLTSTSAQLFTTPQALTHHQKAIEELTVLLKHCPSLANKVHSPYVGARH